MSTWGVPTPQVGRIEGQPILDLRLEEIRAAQNRNELRDTEFAKLVVATIKESESSLRMQLREDHKLLLKKFDELSNLNLEISHQLTSRIYALRDALTTYQKQLRDDISDVNSTVVQKVNTSNQHLFENLCKSFYWWLGNVFWPFMRKPL